MHDVQIDHLVYAVSDYDPGEVVDGQRAEPTGKVLRWRLAISEMAGGLAPFLISWGETEHPARSAPRGLTLEAFRIEHPETHGGPGHQGQTRIGWAPPRCLILQGGWQNPG
jgi:Glyoxalase-like domain